MFLAILTINIIKNEENQILLLYLNKFEDNVHNYLKK